MCHMNTHILAFRMTTVIVTEVVVDSEADPLPLEDAVEPLCSPVVADRPVFRRTTATATHPHDALLVSVSVQESVPLSLALDTGLHRWY